MRAQAPWAGKLAPLPCQPFPHPAPQASRSDSPCCPETFGGAQTAVLWSPHGRAAWVLLASQGGGQRTLHMSDCLPAEWTAGSQACPTLPGWTSARRGDEQRPRDLPRWLRLRLDSAVSPGLQWCMPSSHVASQQMGRGQRSAAPSSAQPPTALLGQAALGTPRSRAPACPLLVHCPRKTPLCWLPRR